MSLIITIGGLPGSGKSTLGGMLAARLGVPFFSMGDVRREYAKARGLTIAELNRIAETDPVSDTLVDAYQKELPKNFPSFVIDSRLGYHFVPGAVKLFLRASTRTCATRVIAQRRSEELWADVEEGMAALEERKESDRRRYRKLYDLDPLDERQYDLVLDTDDLAPLDLLHRVIAYLREKGHDIPA